VRGKHCARVPLRRLHTAKHSISSSSPPLVEFHLLSRYPWPEHLPVSCFVLLQSLIFSSLVSRHLCSHLFSAPRHDLARNSWIYGECVKREWAGPCRVRGPSKCHYSQSPIAQVTAPDSFCASPIPTPPFCTPEQRQGLDDAIRRSCPVSFLPRLPHKGQNSSSVSSSGEVAEAPSEVAALRILDLHSRPSKSHAAGQKSPNPKP
jgi:hypothetical protein